MTDQKPSLWKGSMRRTFVWGRLWEAMRNLDQEALERLENGGLIVMECEITIPPTNFKTDFVERKIL